MVVFALFSEMRAYQMFDVFKPSGLVGDTYAQAKEKCYVFTNVCNIIAFILITIGTVIWGYGDLLVKSFVG